MVILVRDSRPDAGGDTAAQTGYVAGFAGAAVLLMAALVIALVGARIPDRRATPAHDRG